MPAPSPSEPLTPADDTLLARHVARAADMRAREAAAREAGEPILAMVWGNHARRAETAAEERRRFVEWMGV